jgi:hypothetical protein
MSQLQKCLMIRDVRNQTRAVLESSVTVKSTLPSDLLRSIVRVPKLDEDGSLCALSQIYRTIALPPK